MLEKSFLTNDQLATGKTRFLYYFSYYFGNQMSNLIYLTLQATNNIFLVYRREVIRCKCDADQPEDPNNYIIICSFVHRVYIIVMYTL